jgi:hypothetical protein
MVNDGRTRYADELTLQELVRLRVENERLREALKLMVDEKCDYMKINNLGDPEQQHTIKIARAALKGDE